MKSITRGILYFYVYNNGVTEIVFAKYNLMFLLKLHAKGIEPVKAFVFIGIGCSCSESYGFVSHADRAVFIEI